MAFIRLKNIHGGQYAYLSESRWDPETKRASQKVIKYLGAVPRIQLKDIPEEHLSDSVKTFIYRHSDHYEGRRKRAIKSACEKLPAQLLRGNRAKAAEIMLKAIETIAVTTAYTEIVVPTFYQLGEDWAEGRVSVADEHLATNVMVGVLAEVNRGIKTSGKKKGSALVATPDGEQHHLAARLIEGLLIDRGYEVLDISASAPADAIVEFVQRNEPTLVLITVTLEEHAPAAFDLARQLSEVSSRVLVGGQGIPEDAPADLTNNMAHRGEPVIEALDRLGLP